ncbi:MAG: HAMP domain-containing protein [Comamonadaceae bacterium]|nr:HAMP domain-containing protein [Comamonadaceae bacterium]
MAPLISSVRRRVGTLAQRLLPDSLFGRLAMLLVVAVVTSHVLALTLMFEFNPHPPPPLPGLGGQGGPPVGHAPPHLFQLGLLMDISVRLAALILAAWVGARWLSEPVRKLAAAAKALGRDIHRPAMPEDGTLECREATRVFNQMHGRIQQQMAQRDQFVAAVSHDLRTPLTRLSLRVQSLADPDQRHAFARDIVEMDEMIRTTLDYLRGIADLEPTVLLDLSSLLTSLAEDAQDCGQDVRFEGAALSAPLQVQALALRRCIANLIGNAVRYGKRARVGLEDRADRLVITIDDEGPGIPEDELDRVMMPFYRLESSRNRHSGGVGLGLATAHDIAQKHGGSLSLVNRPVQGLSAILSLPRT